VARFPGNSLGLFLCRVVPHSGTIGYYTTDHLGVYFPGTEQAIPPCRHGEPSEGELLGGKLSLYSVEVSLPLEFMVDLNA
jgi:hypothetical protein